MRKIALTILIAFSWTKIFSQSVSILPTQTRVLYQWMDNPLQIVVENTPCYGLVVKAENGKVIGKGCKYIYTTNDTVFRDVIKVGVRRGTKVKWISEQDFRVKKLPDPIVSIGMLAGNDTVHKNTLAVQIGVALPLFDFGFEAFTNERRQVITSYSVAIFRNSQVVFSENVSSNLLTERFKDFITRNSLKNDKIIFDNIVALLYQREIRKLAETFTLTIKD